MTTDGKQSLVSIGIPTYNRPELLARAIASARNQTYPNLEIIVSDNASPDPRVEAVCREAVAADPRIQYFRQPKNIGALPNFEFTLLQASGDYFTWFADDDGRAPAFVEKLAARFLNSERPTALVSFETQYKTPTSPYAFFEQGRQFYDDTDEVGGDALERVRAVMGCAPDNFIYGLFRRECLFHNEKPATRWLGPTMNEHPLFALVAFKGDVVCLPEVGFWKQAARGVCDNAKWEHCGGFHPRGPRINVLGMAKYHWGVFQEVCAAYEALDLPDGQFRLLRQNARERLLMHAVYSTIGWKPKTE